jgi:hypothetical protein
MFSEIKNIPEAWKRAWASLRFRNHFFLSLLVLIGSMAFQFHYLRLWESRLGVQVNDLVQNMLPPFDFSIPIFVLEYSTLLTVFIYTLAEPERLVKGFQMFSIILLARLMSIYLVPLEPPKDMIFLNDPLANWLLHDGNVIVTKDLFFSGHISALSLLTLLATQRWLKYYAAFATLVVSVLIVWQHVHYSMDVAFAPVVSYLTFRGIEWVHAQTKYGLQLQEA